MPYECLENGTWVLITYIHRSILNNMEATESITHVQILGRNDEHSYIARVDGELRAIRENEIICVRPAGWNPNILSKHYQQKESSDSGVR